MLEVDHINWDFFPCWLIEPQHVVFLILRGLRWDDYMYLYVSDGSAELLYC